MSLDTIDKRQVRAAFDRAAARYDEAAVLQRTVGDRLIERLDLVKIAPRRVLDAGTGTGYCLPGLRARYHAPLIALDIAPAMLKQARQRARWWRRSLPLCADIERLPLATGSFSLITSNLTLQWCQLDLALNELQRILEPGGLLMFTTFGPDTLKEVRLAWSEVDARPHVHQFVDMHDIGDALVRAGFSEPVLDVERFTVHYPSARAVLHDLKTIGAHNASVDRFHGLTGKQRFREFEAALTKTKAEGVVAVTFEVVYGHAWAPREKRLVAGNDAPHPIHWLRQR